MQEGRDRNEGLVSIIVPVYNVGECLEKCLKSIAGQTYAEWEALLVDDGSTDGSGEVCDEYAKRDRRFKVIHKANGGVSSARNAGLRSARGESICFVDADDCVHPQYVELLHEVYVAEKADIVICDYERVDEYPSTFEPIEAPMTVIPISYELFNDYSVCKQMSVVAKLYKAEILEGRRFDEKVVFSEDGIYNYSLVYGTPDLKLFKVGHTLYYYYQRPGSAVHTLTRDKALAEVDWYLDHWGVFLPQYEWIVCEHSAKTLMQVRMELYGTPAYAKVMKMWPDLSGRLIEKMKAVKNMSLVHKIKYHIFLKCFCLYRFLLMVNDPTLKVFEAEKKKHGR